MKRILIINGVQPYPFAPGELNVRFFGLMALPTFSAHDVMKNPAVETDFARFDAHLHTHFPETRHAAA
jgi:modulator of drug activity B